jgi:tmRNA-binding protein
MARPRHAEFDKVKTVAENRRARYDYHIDDKYEAGIMLTGTEVKSLRFGEGSIAESYAEVKSDGIWLINANIPEFSHGNRFNHEPKRPRKLLLNVRCRSISTRGVGQKSNWRSPRARKPLTSARPKRSAIGNASRDV